MRMNPAALTQDPPCVFCEIVADKAPAQITVRGVSSIEIVPLHPVTEGHRLVIPRRHVKDAMVDPGTAAFVMSDAAWWNQLRARSDPLYRSVNFITSVGEAATQSVFHLHIHVVPRRQGDGLALPWTAASPLEAHT